MADWTTDKAAAMKHLAAWDGNFSQLGDVSEPLRDDAEVVIVAVTNLGSALEYATDSLKADVEVVKVAVANDGFALQYAADSLKADIEVVKAAAANERGALCFAAASLMADPAMVKELVAVSAKALEHATEPTRDAILIETFPLGEADRVVAARSAQYKAAVAALVARAETFKAEKAQIDKAATAVNAAAAMLADLEAQWKAAKAAKDWKAAKAAKAAMDATKSAAGGSGADNPVAEPMQTTTETWEQIETAADALVGTAPLHGLQYLANAYSREADRKGETDDYDAAEAYSDAAEAVSASDYTVNELTPDRENNSIWGLLEEIWEEEEW